jgi:hypothetical protein
MLAKFVARRLGPNFFAFKFNVGGETMKVRIIFAMALVALFASVASAQTKISGQHKCATAPEVRGVADVGDRAGHTMSLTKNTCQWSKPMEMEGEKTTDGTSISFFDMTATRATSTGTYVGNTDGGDKYFVSFRDTGAVKDGKPEASKGTWSFTGGTGKLKGISGKGTYTVTPGADGSAVVDVEGEYSVAAPAMKKTMEKKKE